MPDFGVYLLARKPDDFPWESRWVQWTDFRTPRSDADAIDALDEAFRRADIERVEIACFGGVGRTGTALAAIAVLAGIPRNDAVNWVRARYHGRAAETPWQRRWVRNLPLSDVTDATGDRRDR